MGWSPNPLQIAIFMGKSWIDHDSPADFQVAYVQAKNPKSLMSLYPIKPCDIPAQLLMNSNHSLETSIF